MVAKQSGRNRGGGGGGTAAATEVSVEELARVPLQAILLADSFATKFRPITLERPKVLLPLVNVPMIDYTLAWLESAGVEEVFVFCCAHAKQVAEHLENSQWFAQPNFSVTAIESNNAVGAGDALRLIYEQNVIRGDFVLVSGDTVSNMSLAEALGEHKERRRKDSNAIMTMVITQSKTSPTTRQSRLGTDELFMAIDPDTKQLLYYEDKSDKGTVSLDKTLLSDHPSIYLHNDKQDCYIDICSPEVLSTFADNFDYQHLRRHFLKGLLDDDIMGYKIFTHEIQSNYAARIDNFRSYDTVSKDIIQRWTYPLVPDVQFFGNSSTKLDRQGMYRASVVGQSRSAQVGPFTVIGSGTTIGSQSQISNSVVGEGCKIGANVSIEGCYIWHNVTIEDGCQLKHAIVCDGVVIKSGVILEPGVVLSYKVVVGQQFIVPAYSKVSLYQQPIKQDSDEELEYADSSTGFMDASSLSGLPDKLKEESTIQLSESQLQAASEVGSGGVGFIWSTSEGSHEEEWRHSVAPIPPAKLLEIMHTSNNELEVVQQDGNLPPSGELERDSVTANSNDYDDDDVDVKDDYEFFENEVEATFKRALEENIKEDDVILEVNSLRLSYNLATADCSGALFYSMMKSALSAPHPSPSDLVKNAATVITKWKKLLKYYLPSIDEEVGLLISSSDPDEIEVILKFEEMCLESAKEYSTVFVQILHLLYDKDIIQEEAILNWASEKEGADETDKLFVKQAEKFIQWLNEASEEED
nr:translation initiation factor eIF-2B subunit epsilon-like isoform X3 [Coffea arabica]